MRWDDLELNYRAFLPEHRDCEILDLGCGTGRVIAFLRSKGYSRILGVDRDRASLEVARSQGADRLEHVEDVRAFLRSRRENFDLVVAKDVIYYFPKAEAVDTLAELRGTLKPGGRLLVEVFNGAAVSGNFIGQKDRHIDWIPNEFNLRQLLTDAGFEVRALHAQVSPPGGVRRRLFNAVGRAWRCVLKLIYIAERGLDPQNPTILTTKMVAYAIKPERS